MHIPRFALAVVTGLLLLGGTAQAQQPFENPELADVQGAFFWNFGKSSTSVVMASMTGGYGYAFPRFQGGRYALTRNGGRGVVVFDLYEPDEVKRSGAGSWQVKQTDFMHMAFQLTTFSGHSFGNGSPYYSAVAGFFSYSGSVVPIAYPMYDIGDPVAAQLEGCSVSITTKDKNRDGLPESASWKAGCNPKALYWLSPDDQKIYKKLLGGLKGKGTFPAYRSVVY